ncbi:MAG: prepilin peptidase [Pirellula sp.]
MGSIDTVELCLILAGLVLGPLINLWIYSICFFPSPVSPWQKRPAEWSSLSVVCKLPIVGWLFRSSDKDSLGKFFWLRPFLIELITPILWVLLYRTVMSGYCIPIEIQPSSAQRWALSVQFASYSILLTLLTVATFIDFDEMTIPDLITVPGTLIGVLGSALIPSWPLWEPQTVGTIIPLNQESVSMHAGSPSDWIMEWGQTGGWSSGLTIAILIWLAWCCAFGNLRWISRRGFSKGVQYAIVSFLRSFNLPLIVLMSALGSVLIIASYVWLPLEQWRALLSSLIGIGLGGALVWSFRLISRFVFGREALGFGDVTLMAMVGAFFGWQIAWIAFFLAPILGVPLIVLRSLLTRNEETPLGPYLSIATAYLMIDWVRFWGYFSQLWYVIPVTKAYLVLLGLTGVLGVLLWVVHSIKLVFSGGANGR